MEIVSIANANQSFPELVVTVAVRTEDLSNKEVWEKLRVTLENFRDGANSVL